MAEQIPQLTIGVEEELFLVDSETRELITAMPDAMVQQFEQQFPEQIVREYLSSQAEIVGKPWASIVELRAELVQLRKGLIDIASEYGFAPIAVSTHPFSSWLEQVPTPKKRYKRLSSQLQMAAHRMLIGGMHIHVGIEDDTARLKVLNQLRWYLPFLLALSTSSPFWQGMDTGFSSYRLSVWGGIPRSGLPAQFKSFADYERYVETLIKTETIKDASEIWWDARMSCRFPTVEMRITDTVTRLDDIVGIAALYKSLIRYFYRHNGNYNGTPALERHLTADNRWHAERFPLSELTLLSRGDDTESLPVIQVYEQLISELQEDAKALNCVESLNRVMDIVKRGTSADRQRRVYQDAIAKGATSKEAAIAVVDDLIAVTADLD